MPGIVHLVHYIRHYVLDALHLDLQETVLPATGKHAAEYEALHNWISSAFCNVLHPWVTLLCCGPTEDATVQWNTTAGNCMKWYNKATRYTKCSDTCDIVVQDTEFTDNCTQLHMNMWYCSHVVYTAAQIVISTLYKITHEYGIMAHCTAAIGIFSAYNFTVQLWQRTKMQCRALPVVICIYRVFFF